jgi:hypothetical protein
VGVSVPGAFPATGGADSVRGSVPVVKSYPQASQNSASAGFSVPQCGQLIGPVPGTALDPTGADPAGADSIGADAAGVDGTAGATGATAEASIGAPHTSQ